MPRALLAALLALLSGCLPSADVDAGPGEDPFSRPAYADTLVAEGQGGAAQACTFSTTCPASGACAEHAALGPPDGASHALPAGGTLELAFICNGILDRFGATGAQPAPDLRIWGTVPAASQAAVSVSEDGTHFELVGTLVEGDLELDLADTPLTAAQFVLIVDGGQGGISLDAVEAL